MKKAISLFTLCLSLLSVFAQQTTFQKVIGANLGTQEGSSIAETSDGGFIITGQSNSPFYANGICLVKTNGNGDTLWTKAIVQGTYQNYTYCIKQTLDGGYAITGATNCFNINHHPEMNLMKTDSLGNFEWEKTYEAPYKSWGNSLQQTIDGGYIITGQANFDSINNNIFLVKTDAFGDTLWTRNFWGAYYRYSSEVCQTSDHGYIVVGNNYNTSLGNNSDLMLIKTDSTGNVLWSKTYGGTSFDAGTSIKLTMDGGYLIAGITGSFGVYGSDVLLMKTDMNGNVIFAKTYGTGSEDYALSVSITTDHGYFLCGYTCPTVAEIYDPYAIKTDSIGNLEWSKTYGYTYIDQTLSGQQTTDGGYVLAGNIRNFAFGDAIYLIKTDENGATGCFWEQNPVTIVGNPSVPITNHVIFTGSGAVVHSIADSLIHTSRGSQELPMCYHAGISEIQNPQSEILISPNPFTSQATITFNEPQKNTTIKIMDVIGKEIKTINFTGKQCEIEKGEMRAGVYFIRIEDEQKNVVNRKIVLQ